MNTYASLLLCISSLWIAACNSQSTKTSSTYSDIAIAVVSDLNLEEGKAVVLEVTQTDLDHEKLGPRDEAVVMTETDGQFTLRYVFRFPQSDNPNLQRWKIWANYENAGDGTGAEVPAIMEYKEKPSPEQVAQFRTRVLSHWSNQ